MNENILKNSSYFEKALVFIQGLDPIVFWIIMFLALLLLLFLVYKVMGLGGALGIMVLVFFIFVLYSNDTFRKFREKERNQDVYDEQLELELQKDANQN